MENYINIFKNRLDDLIKISINHRKNDGPGVLFCNFTDKEKMDVYYIPLNDQNNFPKNHFSYYVEKFEKMPSSFIFFNIFDSNENVHLEFDLDKNSNFKG